MGGVQSTHLSKKDARKIAGELWDEAAFDKLPQNKHGKVSKEDLMQWHHEQVKAAAAPSCPIAQQRSWPKPQMTEKVPLALHFGTHIESLGTRNLLKDIGGRDRLVSMVSRFYNHAFEDQVLDKFIADHNDPHGERLGLWIAEKMGDEAGNVWSDTRPPNARQRSHRAAWNCPKREPERVGRRFKLDDCRIWMRLMFWAAREEGLMEHKPFANWFVQFIGHFIAVYERSAPPYARESALWSEDQENIELYKRRGYRMADVIGKDMDDYY